MSMRKVHSPAPDRAYLWPACLRGTIPNLFLVHAGSKKWLTTDLQGKGSCDACAQALDPAPRRLSDTQVDMLRSVRDHGDPMRHVGGKSERGGAFWTVRSLTGCAEPLMVHDGAGPSGERWALTPASTKALDVAEVRAARRYDPNPHDPSRDFSVSLETLRLNKLFSGVVVSADKRFVAAYRTSEGGEGAAPTIELAAPVAIDGARPTGEETSS